MKPPKPDSQELLCCFTGFLLGALIAAVVVRVVYEHRINRLQYEALRRGHAVMLLGEQGSGTTFTWREK